MYEIQFHPADIRKQVRYYFLSRQGMRWLWVAVAGLALLFISGAILAPVGIQSLLLSGRLSITNQQNETQRAILAQREAALDRLHRQTVQARNRQTQMSLILGAPQTSTGGGGGTESQPVGGFTVPEAEIAIRRARKMENETQALLTLADELASFARSNDELTRAVPSICPLPIGSFVLTSPFGNRTSPFTNTIDFHAGIDLAAREGTPVLAVGDSRVVFAGRFPLSRNVRWWRYGNVVVLKHSERYVSIYAHLQEISVRRGSQLVRGEQLGTVGNTGWSTSPHLHFEVRVVEGDGGEPLPTDPRIFILNYQWTGHEELLPRAWPSRSGAVVRSTSVAGIAEVSIMEENKNFPTMIIPRGTEVSVNEQGQLSMKTPGNLVIQNSGVYSVIESGSGSVRIDPEVQVEAVSVEAADSCFVAGELTAWRVHADKIILEKGALANIMLQESETLELDRNARLVGNFASEKELYLMLGRFSRQLRDLPDGLFAGDQRETLRGGAPPLSNGAPAPGKKTVAGTRPSAAPDPQQKEELLSLVKVIVERELVSPTVGGSGRSALEELLGLVRSGNIEALSKTYAKLIQQVEKPSNDLTKARAMLDKWFVK